MVKFLVCFLDYVDILTSLYTWYNQLLLNLEFILYLVDLPDMYNLLSKMDYMTPLQKVLVPDT